MHTIYIYEIYHIFFVNLNDFSNIFNKKFKIKIKIFL